MTALTLADRRGKLALTATVLGSSLAMLDSTVVNVALPHIGTDMGGGLAGLQWTINAYTLTLAALILLGGTLGDRLGRRKVFLVGVVWFAVASLACGVAPGIWWLVGARALQGIGAALLTPGSLAIIQSSFAPDQRARAIGAWSGLGGIGAAIGPLVGGTIVQHASWRWVFLVNLPVAALVVVTTLSAVPESRDEQMTGRVDLRGVVLSAGGLAALSWGLSQGGGGPALAALVAGLAALVVFVLVERSEPAPMLPPRLFANREFSAVNAATLVIYAALSAVIFFLVLTLQVVAGFSPLEAGSALLPLTVVMLLLSSRSGALAQRIGPRPQLTVGPLVAAAGVALMSRIGPDTSYVVDVLPAVTLLGLGLAITVAPLTATVLAAAEDRYAGIASATNNAVARTGGLLAVAALPAVVGLSGNSYRHPVALADASSEAMWICAGLLVVGAAVSWFGVRPHPALTCSPRQCGVGAPHLCPAREPEPAAVGEAHPAD
jgi:EmrB/QacA subfamily drug resistance transporter